MSYICFEALELNLFRFVWHHSLEWPFQFEINYGRSIGNESFSFLNDRVKFNGCEFLKFSNVFIIMRHMTNWSDKFSNTISVLRSHSTSVGHRQEILTITVEFFKRVVNRYQTSISFYRCTVSVLNLVESHKKSRFWNLFAITP